MAVGKMRYFKCNAGDALLGTAMLNEPQFTLYVRLWWMMYEAGGPLPYEPEKLKFTLHKRPSDIRKLVDQLVTLGKLSIDAENMLHNRRVDEEMESWRANEAQTLAKRSANGAQNGSQESQKSEQDLRARTRSPAPSLEPEPEEERERTLSLNSSKAAREAPRSISEAFERRIRELQQEEIGHDPTGNKA